MPSVEIVTGDLDRPYQVIGPIMARVTAATAFSRARTTEEVDSKLREEALKRGANAVIHATYDRGVSAMSWKAPTVRGLAVVVSSDTRLCPFCAEQVRREAVLCRFCGRDLPEVPAEPLPAAWNTDPTGRHELRYWDGKEWTQHVSDANRRGFDAV